MKEMVTGVCIKIIIQINMILLFLPSNDNVILSATDGGVYKSFDTFADTVEWTSLNNGYYTTQLYAVSISRNANSDLMHGGFQR